MNLTEYVVESAIVPDLQATSKKGAIQKMVAGLREAGKFSADDEENIVAAIMKREELGSTGIGRGIAVPHTKNPNVTDLTATIAIASGEGVDFDSLDGEPVHVLFLLISPPDQPRKHLRALETIAKRLRSDDFCKFLRQSSSPSEVMDLLREVEDAPTA